MSVTIVLILVIAVAVFIYQKRKYSAERTDMIQARLMFLNASNKKAEEALDKKIEELANRKDSDNAPYDGTNRVLPAHGSLEDYQKLQKD